jgi:ubiquinone/menaquinone biosynthesis C-methylase UbiE
MGKTMNSQALAGSRAVQSELLQQRIAENTSAQHIDLNDWIFRRLALLPDDSVLELCCGTGAQTLKMLRLLGEKGRLTALDLSADALKTLRDKAGPEEKRLTLLESPLDNLGARLQAEPLQRPAFDLAFCAYGLYYSSDPPRTLDETKSWLRRDGRMAVVGPFGPNNGPLFDLLRGVGVHLAGPVTFSSERFMTETVMPWAGRNFESISVHTMVNPVVWASPGRVLNYWQNTTFYDAAKRAAVEERLGPHFEQHGRFVNEKWVMLVEMRNARQ